MRRTMCVVSLAVVCLACLSILLLRTPSMHAKPGRYTNDDFWGSFASQWQGTIMLPKEHPLSVLNGPYALTGWIYTDGQGNVKGHVWDCYNGLVIPYAFQGTYDVKPDGALSMTVMADLGAMGKLALDIVGVICDEGKMVRVMTVGIPGAGLPPNYAGTNAVGTLVRQ